MRGSRAPLPMAYQNTPLSSKIKRQTKILWLSASIPPPVSPSRDLLIISHPTLLPRVRSFPIRRISKRVHGRMYRWFMIPPRAQAKVFHKFIRARWLESWSSARAFPARHVCDEQVSAYVSIIGMGVAFSSRNAGYVGLGRIWIGEEGDWFRWGRDSVGVIAEESFLSLRIMIAMSTVLFFHGMKGSFTGIARTEN